MNTPIHDYIAAYCADPRERCHTPGHRGRIFPADITEIDGATEIISESERNAAALFGAERSLYSCCGSTLAIAAMLTPFAGKTIAAFRGTHRSVIDAAILLDINIKWLHGYANPEATSEIPGEAAALFVTNIDYYGNVAPLEELARVAAGIPVLVDNAHGAYLVFTERHPLKLGAAMSADSAHKTLPALTGAAYLHCADDRYTAAVQAGMELFGTSSPSYLILESLDLCNRHIAGEKELAQEAFAAVARLKSDLAAEYTLRESDSLRVTIDANAHGYSGAEYSRLLRQAGVVCEMHEPRYVVLMFSTVTRAENTARVLRAMRSIPKRPPIASLPRVLPVPATVMSPRAAYFSPKRRVPTESAAGEVCAGVHVTVPPCVPVVVPGELLTKEITELLSQSGLCSIDVVAGWGTSAGVAPLRPARGLRPRTLAGGLLKKSLPQRLSAGPPKKTFRNKTIS